MPRRPEIFGLGKVAKHGGFDDCGMSLAFHLDGLQHAFVGFVYEPVLEGTAEGPA
jgi:hypothetical protein